MRAEGRVALSEQSTAAAETARQIEKLNDRQRDFIARTNEAAQAASRQTAEFLRQQRIAKQVAALNLAAPAAQLMLPAAAPGSPAMSGGARRRITGPIERLGGARTLDEAQATLRLAQANTQLAQSTKKVDAEFNRFLPDTNLLNATARGIQRIQTNQEAFNESIARGIRFQEKLNREQERQRRLGIGVPSTTMPGTTGRTAGPFPVEGPIPLSQFGRRPQAAAPGSRGPNRLGGVVSNAVIGGAFPLLFGQGGGAATGGALGGALGGLLGGTGGFAGSLLGTLLGGIAEQGGKIKELAADIGLSADQTTRLQQAFKLAGQDADKFTEAVQNIRGVGLAIEDQAKAIDLVSVLTEKYGGNITKVTNALTGALESGKVTQATLNQLSSQGIDIQGALAERYNTNRDAILKMAKDGTISVQDLIDTLVVLGNKGVKSAETTQSAFTEGFARIQQATERLQQVLVSSFDETGKSIQFSLGAAIQAVTRYVEEFILGLAELSRVAGAALDPIISGYVRIQSAIYNAVTAVPALRDAIVAFAASAFGPLSGVVALIDKIRGAGANRKNKLQGPPVPARLQVPVLRSFAAPAQALPSGAGGAGAKAKKDKTAEELQRSLEQGRALAQEFARQVKLLNTTTDIERKRLQIQFDFEDRQKQISELKNAEQRTSLTTQNQEIRRLELIDLQTEALKKQTDEAEKLFDIIIQGYNFGISREGGTGAGIFGKLSELKQNLDPVKVQVDSIATGATVIGDAFSLAFGEIISGAKSTEQALADTFQQIGDAFINMAVNIIAQQMTMIILGSILKALGLGFNLSGTNALSTGSSPLGGIGGSLGGAGYGGVSGITPIGPSFGGATFPAFFADGGFVTGPTRAMVGEGGQAEYIIPASKMRSAMSRYAAGARGSAVIPAGDDTSGGGTATMAPAAIDVRYTVERINSVDYVTADQFRAGMTQAAQQGATQGEQRTLRRLQQSRATRSRLGMN
jgi:tape measure domain-containing protein